MKVFFLLLTVSLTTAIFKRPNLNSGKYEIDYPRYTKKWTTRSSTVRNTTTTTHVPKCPEGFTLYHRTPTALNNHTSAWCMKMVTGRRFYDLEAGLGLCADLGAVPTIYENGEERRQVNTELANILKGYGLTEGSVAVGARRKPECETTNSNVLSSPPCNDPSTSFYTLDGHSDPTFLWTTWADLEPTNDPFGDGFESCIGFASSLDRFNLLLNDMPCHNIEDPIGIRSWTFGALCGVVPS